MNETYYLEHHGILGMHWGIRRYQNKDGSLTSEGKQRYLEGAKKLAKSALGIYKDNDGNEFVSKRRRDNRNKEYSDYEKAKQKRAEYNAVKQSIKDRKNEEKKQKELEKKRALDEDPRRQKIRNIKRVQSPYNDDAVNLDENGYGGITRAIGTVSKTVAGEIGYRAAAGSKRTTGIWNAGRIAVKVGLNDLENNILYKIGENERLSRYDQSGHQTVRKGSKEYKQSKRAAKLKTIGTQAGMTALRAIADIGITKLANTEWGDTFNRGARQKYDVNGKWATNPDRMRLD